MNFTLVVARLRALSPKKPMKAVANVCQLPWQVVLRVAVGLVG